MVMMIGGKMVKIMTHGMSIMLSFHFVPSL